MSVVRGARGLGRRVPPSGDSTAQYAPCRAALSPGRVSSQTVQWAAAQLAAGGRGDLGGRAWGLWPEAVITADSLRAPQCSVTRSVSVTPPYTRRPSRRTDEKTGVPLSKRQSPELVSRGAGAGTQAHRLESSRQRGPRPRRGKVSPFAQKSPGHGPPWACPSVATWSVGLWLPWQQWPTTQRDTTTFPSSPTQRFQLFRAVRGTGHVGASGAVPRPSAERLVDLTSGLRTSP